MTVTVTTWGPRPLHTLVLTYTTWVTSPPDQVTLLQTATVEGYKQRPVRPGSTFVLASRHIRLIHVEA